MRCLLLLSALASFDVLGVIAGPVPDQDTALIPRADAGTEAAQPNTVSFDLDLTDSSKSKDDDDDGDTSCWWWWKCPKPKPTPKSSTEKFDWCFWGWCKPDDDDNKPVSWYGYQCPGKDDLSCDSCGGETGWDGKEYATKGWAAGCECSNDDDDS
ncbi:hypothetical protein DOTSEDRAFT_27606 [Dothistroma septosporum NZE10]|uniref:Uncharacterized protein n=1 Tax=Dothistroma septosporum (strain NZE10 / CBS 128990) TaxID=675120 RepID=N1PEG5_DOTSN|nr:hypothetical protein DOTSEDRAFT_27606 [Dothistroma septosporum NZE10]